MKLQRIAVLALLITGIVVTASCGTDNVGDSGPRNRRPKKDVVHCFDTFYAAKKHMLENGVESRSRHQWLHIVGQRPANQAKFGEHDLHCCDNLIYLPIDMHRAVSGHYMRKFEWTNGKRVHQWLTDKDFDEQYSYGMRVLRDLGVDPAAHGLRNE